jgi:hypothetical protein
MQFGALSSCTALIDGSYFVSKRSIENYDDFLTLDVVQNLSNLVNVKNKNSSLSL